jgi:hypothetical protein
VGTDRTWCATETDGDDKFDSDVHEWGYCHATTPAQTTTPAPITATTPAQTTTPAPITDCQEENVNLQDREGEEVISNIATSGDCSDECTKRAECTDWIWHRETAGKWANQCFTLTGFGRKNHDENTISGARNCGSVV